MIKTRKISKILFTVISVMMFAPRIAQGLIIGGGTPTIDGLTDGAMSVDFTATTLKTTVMGYVKTVQENLQLIKSRYEQYKNDFIGVMNGENKSPIPGTRTIEDSQLAASDDPTAVQRAIYDLFMTYPSSDYKSKQVCDKKLTQFYIDTIIEINTAAQKLEQEFNNELKPKVENLTSDIMGGENGAEVADSNNAAWKNKYNVYKTLDDLVEMYEELVAMDAQFTAAKAMKDDIPRLVPSSEGDYQKDSHLLQDEVKKYAATKISREVMAFGQLQGTDTSENSSSGYQFRYDPSKSSAISFQEDVSTDMQSPYAGNEAAIADLATLDPTYHKVLAAMQIHNLIQTLPSKKKVFIRYNQFVKLHEKTVEKLKASDQCVRNLLGHYYEDADKTWYGDVFIGTQITDYDLREGLSRWAIDSYEALKAAKANNYNQEDYAETDLSPYKDSEGYTVSEEQESKMMEGANTQTNSGYKTKSKEEAAQENEREVTMLAWNVGAEAMELLAQDQYSATPQWGTVKNKFPIWTDQKSFYGQYLDGKYENMKKIIDRMDLRAGTLKIAMRLNEISSKPKIVKNLVQKYLQKQYLKVAANPILTDNDNDEYAQITAEKAEAIETLQENLSQKLSETAEKRKVSVAELDMEQESKNNNVQTLNEAEIPGRVEEPREGIDTEDVREEISVQDKKISNKNKTIASIDQQSEAYKNAYINKEQKIEKEYASAIADIPTASIPKLSTSITEQVSKTIMQADITAAAALMSSVVSKAEDITTDMKNYAKELIDQARQDIYAMGDEIYLPSGGEAVLERHQELIRALKSLSFKNMSEAKPSIAELAGWLEGEKFINETITSVITGQICQKYSCTEADEEYYVSQNARFRDFVGPKAAPATTTAPMREVVHMDYVDYQNLPKLDDGSISKKDILSYGQKVPAVWEYMLKNPAYVEKDINLEAALSKGNEELSFLRGGFLPCRMKSYALDMNVKRKSYSIRAYNSSEALNDCIGYSLDGIMIKDESLAENNTAMIMKQEEDEVGSSSELGTLLKYADNKIYFNDSSKTAYDRVSEIYANANEDYSENIKDKVYENALFSRNQIGDFLTFMDLESEMRQNKDELEEKVTEIKTELTEELSKAGFTPTEDFDLSKEEDYNLARTKLDELKEQWLQDAAADINKVTTPDNSVVKDRLDTLKNMISVLQMDKNELMNVSEATKADDAFAEEIKSEEVNQAAADKYISEADEEFEKRMNSLPTPYCATY